MAAQAAPSAANELSDALAAGDIPSWKLFATKNGVEAVEEAVWDTASSRQRVLLAAAWHCFDGLPPSTVGEADRNLQCLFTDSKDKIVSIV